MCFVSVYTTGDTRRPPGRLTTRPANAYFFCRSIRDCPHPASEGIIVETGFIELQRDVNRCIDQLSSHDLPVVAVGPSVLRPSYVPLDWAYLPEKELTDPSLSHALGASPRPGVIHLVRLANALLTQVRETLSSRDFSLRTLDECLTKLREVLVLAKSPPAPELTIEEGAAMESIVQWLLKLRKASQSSRGDSNVEEPARHCDADAIQVASSNPTALTGFVILALTASLEPLNDSLGSSEVIRFNVRDLHVSDSLLKRHRFRDVTALRDVLIQLQLPVDL